MEDEIMQKILIVSESTGYLPTSIQNLLSEQGYQAVIVPPQVNQIRKEEAVDLILINAVDTLQQEQAALVYIRDKAVEEDIPVFLMGDKQDVDMAAESVLKQNVRKTVLRPINIKDLVKDVDDYIKNHGRHNKKKVLVVDDSGAMLRNVKGWLEDRYQVILANSGAMAIKYLATNRPDLILLDYEMPIVDGKQVLEMIRAEIDFADIPVIFLTSKGDKESVMKVMALKPEGYLLKTMKPEQIIQAVDDFFEKRKWNNG